MGTKFGSKGEVNCGKAVSNTPGGRSDCVTEGKDDDVSGWLTESVKPGGDEPTVSSRFEAQVCDRWLPSGSS